MPLVLTQPPLCAIIYTALYDFEETEEAAEDWIINSSCEEEGDPDDED